MINNNRYFTEQGRNFMNHYTSLLSGNQTQRISKKLILKYHKLICQLDPTIMNYTREHVRCIYRYYNSFAHQENKILNLLRQLIANGTVDYEHDCNQFLRRRCIDHHCH